MEQVPQSAIEEKTKKSTAWGAIISLILILAVVVAGAYYSFTKRYHPSPAPVQVQH